MLSRFKGSDFLKNTAKLATGTTIAQVIVILTAPITYRIYSKEAYGTLGLYMAITGVLGVFSTFQYTQTILLEKDVENAKIALWLNRIINTSFSVLVVIVIAFLYRYLGSWFNNDLITPFLWMIPISIFFGGQNEILRVLANRLKEYNILTLNKILTSILVPIVSISIGVFITDKPIGLFVALLASQVFPALYLTLKIRKKFHFGFEGVTFSEIISVARENRQFPIFSLPSDFVYRFTAQLPVFMLSRISGAATVGIFGLCNRMLGLPIQFIGSSISTVYQQKATQSVHEIGNCFKLFRDTASVLAAITILPTLIVFFFGPELFGMFFGEQWSQSGEFARIFIIMFSLHLIVSPLSYIFYIKKKLKEDFIFHIFLFLAVSLAYFGVLKFSSVQSALVTHSVLYSLWYIAYFYRSYKLST